MWLARTILVDGKVFTWKASRLYEKLPVPEDASCGIGGFGGRYFPNPRTHELVEIHCALFESEKDWRAWMASKQMHPAAPMPLAFENVLDRASLTPKQPLKEATFKLVAQGTKEQPYWWVEDDIQHKPW